VPESHSQSSVRNILALIAVLGLCISCGEPKTEADEVVARVKDAVLLSSELNLKLPKGLSEVDSARMTQQFVKDWILEKALLTQAEENLPAEQKDVQKQLDEYRSSLLVYAYERALINQKLDTLVNENELQAFYDENRENFKLKSYIVKLRFIKLSADAPKLKNIERWLNSDKDSDFDALYEHSRSYAENFFFDESIWLYLEEVLKEIPLPADDLDNFFKQHTYYTFESNQYVYFVRIYDYKLKGDVAPFALEKGRVRDFILNKRKAELISRMREDLVQEGIESGEIYIKP
jgi:hypothetical protein